MWKIHHSKKITLFYDNKSVGNHLYCDGFTLPLLIPSYLKKILTIDDNQNIFLQISMQYMDYSDGKKLSNPWKIRAWIPPSKFYHFQWLRSIANIIYWEGSNFITNTFFLFKKINYLQRSTCLSQIQTN